jgi:TRAP-type uncharacterized transport system fused permease subunit
MRTGLTALKLAIAAFIVPYVFALNPAMLFIDTNWYDVILIVISSVAGIFGLAICMEGYVFTKAAWWTRILFGFFGVLLVIPGWVTDAIGISGILLLLLWQYLQSKRHPDEPTPDPVEQTV